MNTFQVTDAISSSALLPARVCAVCGALLPPTDKRGRRPKYCSRECKQSADNLAKRTPRAERVVLLPDGPRRTCLFCGMMFRPRNRDHQYCSNTCKADAQRIVHSATCSFCGKDYRPKRNDRVTYCSRQCAFAHKNHLAMGRELDRLWQVRIVVQMVCVGCGSHLSATRQRFCQSCTRRRRREEQAERDAASKVVETLTCHECGKNFRTVYGTKNKAFCSVECRRKQSRRIAKATRRARQKALPYESIDPIAVFERDGWRCHICGGLTLPFLRGSIEPDAPELDHVIALANGGSHIWNNVACSHRRCNFEKGASS